MDIHGKYICTWNSERRLKQTCAAIEATGDNCIQICHLWRYIVGYTVGNIVLRQRVSGAVKHDFRPYIWRYTFPNDSWNTVIPIHMYVLTFTPVRRYWPLYHFLAETLRERLRTHKVFTKDQCFYLNYHEFSIKSYVLDVY